jgi:hypothetical protein
VRPVRAAYLRRMRDQESVDSELRLVVLFRQALGGV